jgi:hypothetical protein
VHRDAVRIRSKGGPKGIAHVAFRNTDGTHVLILTNPGKERAVFVKVNAEQMAEIRIPGDSMVTALWRGASEICAQRRESGSITPGQIEARISDQEIVGAEARVNA